MKGPPLNEILEAITRFTERLDWFAPFGPTEEAAPAETVQAILDEWELLEPHLAQLEAMGHKERLAPLRKTAEGMRARVRVAFLLQVREFLQVAQLYLANELMMRLPRLLKKAAAKEEIPPFAAQALEALKALMGKLPEPEVVFRESMEAADKCEILMTQLYQKLQKSWPDHWTDEMQRRLENLTEEDHEKWLEEVEQELNALYQRYFS